MWLIILLAFLLLCGGWRLVGRFAGAMLSIILGVIVFGALGYFLLLVMVANGNS